MTEHGTEPQGDEVREKINEMLAWMRVLYAWILEKHDESPGSWEELKADRGPRTMPEAIKMMRGGGVPPAPPPDLP